MDDPRVRGRIEAIEPETPDSVTVVIRPGWVWPGHLPGQFLRVGVVVDGIHHWRAYSLTSDPGRPDGCISITPKLLGTGKVSPYLVRQARPGTIVRLGGVEGEFTLLDPIPRALLFISAGSGITPIMSMLRDLDRRDRLADAAHVHSARTAQDVVFGTQLHALAARHPGYRLHLQLTGAAGRLAASDLERLCPDWRGRETFASGPGAMLDALTEHWSRAGVAPRLRMERFQPVIDGHGAGGSGGPIAFTASATHAQSDGTIPILVAGERAGLDLAYGCRMGICRTCVGRLGSGRVRDLRTGKVSGQRGEIVRTCINAPEGPIEIAL
ncbi:ferredoxin reductase [Solirubrobacter sp. CPCC 204708]|uniref:Ferredoxin reductase n=1 Tax=Solirubrobacter deserti TaxID=2282478 RepID=A0ABT4RDJ9_9ACTN|nr:ferredoxin reductase [Solirubrobacter deserti]MDA0136614.1 ferredoxin reductase [Solirubrobacter deserti]